MYRATYCTRTGPLPLLPSGPGGVGGIASRRTRHTSNNITVGRVDEPSAWVDASTLPTAIAFPHGLTAVTGWTGNAQDIKLPVLAP